MTRNRGLVEERIGLRYGAGGNAMRSLIEQVFLPGLGRIDGVGLEAMDDGAALRVGDDYLVITTDSHVVHPIEFPGGDIGRLAIAGTVNDLAMMGATEPLALTCAVVIEEGFQREVLERLWASLRATCDEARTTVVTGDTKVMGKGELDGIMINTTGVGFTRRLTLDGGLRPGDRLIATGTMGDHGLCIMALRGKLDLDVELRSDVAPLNDLIRRALQVGGDAIVALKDPTRGGLSSALHEMAEKSGVGMLLEEEAIPVRSEVRAVGELLGIDPLLVANEGKAVIGVEPRMADAVLDAVRAHPLGRDAALIGVCTDERPGRVVLDTGFGRRLLAEPDGVLLPRIC